MLVDGVSNPLEATARWPRLHESHDISYSLPNDQRFNCKGACGITAGALDSCKCMLGSD